MERIAIFVDAGYLYAAGSIALIGSNKGRANLSINRSAIVEKLLSFAREKSDGASILRIYWYDGVSHRGLSYEQQELARMDNVKLRLGVINAYGQQKGVDSLLVADIVELARNQAIADAVVLSGDEDVRVGVQIAQSFGVRVHLLGIEPSRANQSDALRQEADTTSELSKEDVRSFLDFVDADVQRTVSIHDASADMDISAKLDLAVDEYIGNLNADDLKLVAALHDNDHLPYALDSRLLAISRKHIGSDLNQAERHYIRSRFKSRAKDFLAD